MNTRINKTAALLQSKQALFHTRDLAILWDISNTNTLYTTISRFVRSRTLIPVQKGLYSKIPLEQADPLEIGMFLLHRYAYVSCETILAASGIIHQATYQYTLVSSVSKTYSLLTHNYKIRKLSEKYLLNTAEITTNERGILTASTERAIADLLYFQPTYHFDASSTINWEKVKNTQKEVGYI
jgi:hypothetical protein